MENEDSTSNDPIDFPDERKYLQTIGKATDSQPTKTKVTAFKSRVFKLIKIYTEKSTDLAPLLNSFNQQIFSKEPEKMNEVVLQVISKSSSIDNTRLTQLLEIYKVLLLHKAKSDISPKLCQTFVKILKRVLNDGGEKIIEEMLEKVITKRNCKINVTFFQFLVRKIPSTKKLLISSCQNISKNSKLRPAQVKQLQKLKNKLNKKQSAPVKKQEVII